VQILIPKSHYKQIGGNAVYWIFEYKGD